MRRLDIVRCRACDEQGRAGVARIGGGIPCLDVGEAGDDLATDRCARRAPRQAAGSAAGTRACLHPALPSASAASACARVMPGVSGSDCHRLGDRAQMRRIRHRRDVGDDQPRHSCPAASAPPASPPCRPSNGRAASPAMHRADPACSAHRRPSWRSAYRRRAGSRHDCADRGQWSTDVVRMHAAPCRNCGRNRTGRAAAPTADRPAQPRCVQHHRRTRPCGDSRHR